LGCHRLHDSEGWIAVAIPPTASPSPEGHTAKIGEVLDALSAWIDGLRTRPTISIRAREEAQQAAAHHLVSGYSTKEATTEGKRVFIRELVRDGFHRRPLRQRRGARTLRGGDASASS
jgi:hypothetical protein